MKPKPEIAAKHFDPCEIEDCKYSSKYIGGGNGLICCFGQRYEGCPYLDPDLKRRLKESKIMSQEQFFKCECGSTVFRIRMDHNWETPVTNPKTGEDDMECSGSIECAYCGKNFMELGR